MSLKQMRQHDAFHIPNRLIYRTDGPEGRRQHDPDSLTLHGHLFDIHAPKGEIDLTKLTKLANAAQVGLGAEAEAASATLEIVETVPVYELRVDEDSRRYLEDNNISTVALNAYVGKNNVMIDVRMDKGEIAVTVAKTLETANTSRGESAKIVLETLARQGEEALKNPLVLRPGLSTDAAGQSLIKNHYNLPAIEQYANENGVSISYRLEGKVAGGEMILRIANTDVTQQVYHGVDAIRMLNMMSGGEKNLRHDFPGRGQP